MADINELRKRNVLNKTIIHPTVDDKAPSFTTSLNRDTELNLDDIKLLQNLYNPETENIKKFSDLIANKPERGKPSLARTIVASGVGLKGGVKGAEEVLNAPHARAMSDWQSSVEPAQQAANLERQTNTNERQLLGTMVNASREQQRLKEQTRQGDERIRIQQDKQRLEQMKAEGYEFNFDGAYVMRYKQDGTLENTGVKTENLSQADRLVLSSQLALNNQMIMEGQNRITRQMSTPDDNLTDNQMTARRQTRLRSATESSDPRILGLAQKWIRERNGVLELRDRPEVTGRWGSATAQDVQDYDELLRHINSQGNDGSAPSGGTASTTTSRSSAPSAPVAPARNNAPPPARVPTRANQPGPGPGAGNIQGSPLREEAIAELKRLGKATSEVNIQFYIQRMSR